MELFKELKEVLQNFDIDGTLISASPYGFGHINTTYLVVYENGDKPMRYILQKINTSLFKSVDELMSNIALVTDFNRERIIKRGGNPDRESLTVIKTKSGENYYRREDGECFRVFIFIENTVAYQTVTKPKDFYYSAIAFGSFSNLLAEFDASKLYEILPNFHNTKVRYQNFLAALEKDEFDRAKDCQKEIEFIKAREHYYSKIVDLLESGKMPLKVTHNDTKLNNVLLDDKTGEPVAVIDLDTIMPGSLCYDFGDSIRFGCNPCDEDEKDLSKVNFRLDLYEMYLKGYLEAVGERITDIEKENLAFGSILMTIECGMRFLTDYLSGDTYFRTHRPGQNLDRARTQLKLVSDMEKIFNQMNALVK
ncbi:MAG: phosphotransferase [Clostridia bacterium]|nr:phosphotransferase [Clostridia bacterium]